MLSSVKTEQQTEQQRLQVLEQAFERFNQAGAKLEARYQLLLRETEVLREQLREKDLEVKRSEKLALLGETAAAIAHEVRNPLGAIKLFISLLRRDVNGNPGAEKLVDQIDASIGSLDHAVSNILQFARGKELVFAPTNVHALIQEQLVYFRPAERNAAVIDLSLGGNPFIMANAAALRQVIHNLILNAHQATRHSGAVSIACSDSENGDLQLTVSDNGPGIGAELLERIFDPFVTSKAEGTGLGLAIVKQLVNEHGGTISAWNDHGAHFRMLLPRRRGAKNANDPANHKD